jgi:hypothetical protein
LLLLAGLSSLLTLAKSLHHHLIAHHAAEAASATGHAARTSLLAVRICSTITGIGTNKRAAAIAAHIAFARWCAGA